MVFTVSYWLLVLVLLAESLVIGFVARETVRAARELESSRSAPMGLIPAQSPPSVVPGQRPAPAAAAPRKLVEESLSWMR